MFFFGRTIMRCIKLPEIYFLHLNSKLCLMFVLSRLLCYQKEKLIFNLPLSNCGKILNVICLLRARKAFFLSRNVLQTIFFFLFISLQCLYVFDLT
jgi:hypothetical protein